MLWYDGRLKCDSEERLEHNAKRKRDSAAQGEGHQEKEEEVDATFKELLEKHGQTFSTPKLQF